MAGLVLFAFSVPSAGAAPIVGSTTDPVGDIERPDVKQLDVIYDEGGGAIDFRVYLKEPPYGGDSLSGTLRLGQSWNGTECVTNTAPFDLSFTGSWVFQWGGTATPYEPWGQLFLQAAGSSLSALRAPDATGIGTWIGATVRATAPLGAAGGVYQGRRYVCAGDFELKVVNQGRHHNWTGADTVQAFPLTEGGTLPPVEPVPGTIDVTSPLVLDKDEYKPGDVMSATALWRNPGESNITARQLVLTIRPAGQPGVEGWVGDFTPIIEFPTLTPGQTVNQAATFALPKDVAPGRWVLWATWQDTGEAWHRPAAQPFTIRSNEPVGPSSNPSNGSRPLVAAAIGSRRLGRVLRQGLRVEVELSTAGRVDMTALLTRRQAAQFDLPRTIASGSKTLSGNRPRNVRVRFTEAARRALARLSKLKFTLRIEATAKSGRKRVTTRAVTLRRN